MRAFRAVYRGYAIYVRGAGLSWSFNAEPILTGKMTADGYQPGNWQ